MPTATTLDDQLNAGRDDPLRVLVVGAGVAGLTLAGVLRARGLHPVVVERDAAGASAGYMLALMPLVDPAMDAADVREAYRAASAPLHRYELHGRHGEGLREYSMDELLARFGDYRGIARGELLGVLASRGTLVSYDTTVTALDQSAAAARATFSNGAEAEFDAIIAADGLHSGTRGLILRPDEVDRFDSGWGGWVAWTEQVPSTADAGVETWGAGFFVGSYPVKDRAGIFIGGDRRDTVVGPRAFVDGIRAKLRREDRTTSRALEAVASAEDPYFWNLVDCRSAQWAVGRACLLGDAAAGFLPTAGIGAAMAMEAAGLLAEGLVSASRATAAEALRDFERRERPRVEAAQDNSRSLARLIFHRNGAVAAIRDLTSRFIPLGVALGSIRKLHATAPAA